MEIVDLLKDAYLGFLLLHAQVSSWFLRKPIHRPIFLLGCGRSGKTTLGKVLSFHPLITFLDERSRAYWIASYPQTDIWSERAKLRGGQLSLSDEDASNGASLKLRCLFRFATVMARKPVLVHSLAVNNFRLPFIDAIFPDALYVHIFRNGVDVAESIKERADHEKWYGHDDYKWRQLTELASRRAETAALLPLCGSNFERGLLEWRLGLDAIDAFVGTISRDRFFEISYEDLVLAPVETVHRMLSFVGLDASPEFDDIIRKKIHHGAGPSCHDTYSVTERAVTEALLGRWVSGTSRDA